MSDYKRHTTRTRGVYYRLNRDGKRRYLIGYRDSEGKAAWKSEPAWTLVDAEEALAKVKDRTRQGERIAPSKARRIAFGEFAGAWLAEQTHLRPRTRDAYRWALDQHLLPRFEHRRVASLSEQDASEMIAEMRGKGYSGSTMQAVLLPLSQVLRQAVRRGIIATNPLDRLERKDRPHKARGEKRCLDRDEIGKLLDAADDAAMRTLLALSVSTGLRQGEALGLKWGDLDLAASLLRVRAQLGRDGKLAEPKTPQAKREVDLGSSLVAMLREHRLRSLHSQPRDYVFASADGSPLHYRAVVRALDAAAKRAGLNPDGVPKLRWHDLRHTAASVLIAEGLNVGYVSRALGHANPSITLNVYAHEFGRAEHSERARDAMDAALPGSGLVAGHPEPGGKRPVRQVAETAQLREIKTSGN